MGNQNKIADTIKADEVAKISFAKNLGRSDTFYSIKDSCLSLSSDEIHEIVDRYYNPKIPQPLNAKTTPKSENLPKRKSGKTWLVALGIIAATALLGEFVYYNRPGRNSTSVQQQESSQQGYVQQTPQVQSVQEDDFTSPKTVGLGEWMGCKWEGEQGYYFKVNSKKDTTVDLSEFECKYNQHLLNTQGFIESISGKNLNLIVLDVSVRGMYENPMDVGGTEFILNGKNSIITSDHFKGLEHMLAGGNQKKAVTPRIENNIRCIFFNGIDLSWLNNNFHNEFRVQGDPLYFAPYSKPERRVEIGN